MDEENLFNLANQLGGLLKKHGLKLALAESCTGGMASQYITAVSGSSTWFDRGFVCYSNLSKMEMLNVTSETLLNFGAVSEETAAEMALGALKNSQANIVASITGIAGPDGGSPDKPVGTVCFSWAGKANQIKTINYKFDGNRHSIRQQATSFMIKELIHILEKLGPST